MLCSLVLAASMSLLGQSIDNAGNLWTGSGYVFTVFDTSKPLRFQGGGLSVDLFWQPGMDGFGGGFASLPFIVGTSTRPITLQFYSRVGYNEGHGPKTWGLVETDGVSVGDSMVEFDSGSATNVTGRTTRQRMWAINRAGATNFTITQ